MSTDLVDLGRSFAEIISSHVLSRVDEIDARDDVNHDPHAAPGLDGVKTICGAVLAGVPDPKVHADDVFASAASTRVVGRYRSEGTRTGDVLGWPATGNPFRMRSIEIWRVEGGRFVERWDELDAGDGFTQVGAVRPVGPAS